MLLQRYDHFLKQIQKCTHKCEIWLCFRKRFFVLTCGTDTACVDGTWKEDQDAKPFLPKLDTEEIRTLSDESIKQTE